MLTHQAPRNFEIDEEASDAKNLLTTKDFPTKTAITVKEEYILQLTHFFYGFFEHTKQTMHTTLLQLISEYAIEPTIKIIHIKQTHQGSELQPAFINHPKEMEKTVQSQFQVAQVLRKYAESPIVVEGNYKDEQNVNDQPLATVARKIFPQGFPDNYFNLTKLQKEFLYDQGAARLLLYLGEIKAIYKCTRHNELAENKTFFKKFMASIKSHPLDDKRKLCLLSSKEEKDINIKPGKIYIKPLKNTLEYALLDNDDKTINRGKITAQELGKKMDEIMLNTDSTQIIKKLQPLLSKIVEVIKKRGHLSNRVQNILTYNTRELREYVYDSREEETIACATEAASKHTEKWAHTPIVIIFGAAHDFKPHCERKGIALEVIDASKMQNQEKIKNSYNSSGFFKQLSKQFDRAVRERAIREELRSLSQKGLYI